MKWESKSNKQQLIELAADAEGNRYQIMAKRGTRLWQVFKNGILIDERFYTRHNAKALVDPTIEPREDLRKHNGGFTGPRKPRRTAAEILLNKDALCSRCGNRDKTGAVIDVTPTEWEKRQFSVCMACLLEFSAFIAPIQRPVPDPAPIWPASAG